MSLLFANTLPMSRSKKSSVDAFCEHSVIYFYEKSLVYFTTLTSVVANHLFLKTSQCMLSFRFTLFIEIPSEIFCFVIIQLNLF